MVKKLIIIDDDELNNLVCQMVVKTAEFAKEVQCFLSPHKALAFLKEEIKSNLENFPDVIFIDINMPGMDGWEFINEYRNFPESVKKNCFLFMLSSSIDEEDINHAKTFPEIREYLSKPLVLGDLLEIKNRLNL